MYKALDVFFMTGTGNSYLVATWAAEAAKWAGVQIAVQSIGSRVLQGSPPVGTVYVFCFPTHGFTAPWRVIRYILMLPWGRGAAAVVLPTRAGTRIVGVALPGMEGTAGYLPAWLLLLKGYKIKGVKAFDMPSNWTAVHWGLNEGNTQYILSAAKPKVQGMIRGILAGKKIFAGRFPLILGIALAPISVMYVILGQFILAKLFFASNACAGCGLCARLCPQQAIRMTGKAKNRYPYWSYSCDSCMACMNYCPCRAIEASPLLALVFYYLATVPVTAYLLQALLGVRAAWLPQYGELLLQYGYYLLAVFLAYHFFHWAMKWKWFRGILGSFAHTRYFRRYRATALTAEDWIRLHHNR